jgi:gamma-glutamyl hercynylcysteine S-oxide synthase
MLLGRRPLPPERDVDPDRVFVGGGPFTLGVDAAAEPFSLDNERPAHTVDVGPFWIGRVPVSNRQWREFIGDGGYQRQQLWSARGWAHPDRGRPGATAVLDGRGHEAALRGRGGSSGG